MEFSEKLIDDLVDKYASWIEEMKNEFAGAGGYLSESDFDDVKCLFPPEIQERAKLIAVDAIPHPSFSSFGFPDLDYWNKTALAGITYDDVIFMKKIDVSPALVFHETIHVVQSAHLGNRGFNKLYGVSILHDGYEGNPLEKTAYKFQDKFENGNLSPHFLARIRHEASAARKSLGGKISDLITAERPPQSPKLFTSSRS